MAVTEYPPKASVRERFAPTARGSERNVVWLRGEHDLTTVTSLAGDLARAIAANDDDLLLDLSAVRFMSAATLGIIVGAENFLRPRSRSVLLRDPSASARRVLDLFGHAYDTGACARGPRALNPVEL